MSRFAWPPTLLLLALLSAASPMTTQAGQPPLVSKQDPPPESLDPRDAEDPRGLGDPRDAGDPREAERKPGVDEVVTPLEGEELFDELYASGNLAELSVALSEDAWGLSLYIADQCEQWLKQSAGLPKTPSPERDAAQVQEDKAREFARLADASLGDTRFGFAADTLLSLNKTDRALHAEQRALLRQAESLLDVAGSRAETLPALTPLRQSLSRAQELQDLWGQGHCLELIGHIQALNGRSADARSTMLEAVRIGRSVRDLDAVWNGLSVITETSMRQQDFHSAKEALQEQHGLSLEIGDLSTARQVLEQLVQLDEYMGSDVR